MQDSLAAANGPSPADQRLRRPSGNGFGGPFRWIVNAAGGFCPVAMRWLESRFPGDMRFLVGSSHDLLPGYVAENPNLRVDILRLDGARKFFYSDFKMLRPLLHAESYIIFDEPGWPQCRETVQRLMDEGALRPDPEFSPLDRLFDQDPVMRLA